MRLPRFFVCLLLSLFFIHCNITNGDPKFSIKVLIITKLNHYFIWKSPLFLLNLGIR